MGAVTRRSRHTYRSTLSSLMVGLNVYGEATLATFALLLVPVLVGLPIFGAALLAFVVPVPIALWRAVRLSVTLDGERVVIRNPWRTYRLVEVERVRVAYPLQLKGVGCLAFVDHNGRVVKAWTMMLWYRGAFRERPGRTIAHVDEFFRPWVDAHLSPPARFEYEHLRHSLAARRLAHTGNTDRS